MCPIESIPKSNLKFLIGLRHEIEHQMTSQIDDYLSARFQACCLNYNRYIKQLFGDDYGIDKHLSFSLQFSSISEEQTKIIREFSDLPKNIATYINAFDASINDYEFNNPQYSYGILYTLKTVNKRSQADKVIEFIPADSPEAENINKEYVVIKDREKPKFLPWQIVSKMKEMGFAKFTIKKHTDFWKLKGAKNPTKGYGVSVAKTWYWYENWIQEVEKECKEHREKYT